MRNLSYLVLGTIFGLTLTKGEAISWFRMQEMFHFHDVHMYGIFFTAIPVGALSLFILKKFKVRSLDGELITPPKKVYHHGLIFGGLIFGFGWALTGACPGPLYAQVGSGYIVTVVTFLFAVIGTWVYARIKPFLSD